jgi:periplasmic protein TonB
MLPSVAMTSHSSFYSAALHVLVLAILCWWPRTSFVLPEQPPPVTRKLIWSPERKLNEQAWSGGGARAPQVASRGAMPRVMRPLFQPPAPVELTTTPKLILDTGVDMPVPRLDLPVMGDPLAAMGGPPSGGAGDGKTLGDGRGGRFGDGRSNGPEGFGGIRRVLGATPPVLLEKVEPDYSDEARKARLQGSVLIAVDVDEGGQVTNVRVLRALGLGLDEQAMEAVRKWRFRPARKDGRAIAYPAAIEVRFRLL